jgi:hypothetical protein
MNCGRYLLYMEQGDGARLRFSATVSFGDRKRRSIVDDLRAVRSECLKVQELISTASDRIQDKRRSLNLQKQAVATRFRQSAPHSPTQRREYVDLIGDYFASSGRILQLMYQHGTERSVLFVELLKPEILDPETKMIYAERILADLRRGKKEYLPQLEESVEQLSIGVMKLRHFVDSQPRSPTDEVGSEERANDSASAVEDFEDDPPHFELRDEFLDSPEYRRVAKAVFENILTPILAQRPSLLNLQESFERQIASMSLWHSSGSHNAPSNRWMAEHISEGAALNKSISGLLQGASVEIKNANRAFRISLDSDGASALDSLRQYHDSLKVQIDHVLQVLHTDIARAVAISNEIIRYVEMNGRDDRKRVRRIWSWKKQ